MKLMTGGEIIDAVNKIISNLQDLEWKDVICEKIIMPKYGPTIVIVMSRAPSDLKEFSGAIVNGFYKIYNIPIVLAFNNLND
jgi:hypothetical protein